MKAIYKYDGPLGTYALEEQNGLLTLPILIPCHRVIGSGGKLTGYTGGLNIKIGLLQIEGALDLSLWPESPNY